MLDRGLGEGEARGSVGSRLEFGLSRGDGEVGKGEANEASACGGIVVPFVGEKQVNVSPTVAAQALSNRRRGPRDARSRPTRRLRYAMSDIVLLGLLSSWEETMREAVERSLALSRG
jgi:hypothetical protein